MFFAVPSLTQAESVQKQLARLVEATFPKKKLPVVDHVRGSERMVRRSPESDFELALEYQLGPCPLTGCFQTPIPGCVPVPAVSASGRVLLFALMSIAAAEALRPRQGVRRSLKNR